MVNGVEIKRVDLDSYLVRDVICTDLLFELNQAFFFALFFFLFFPFVMNFSIVFVTRFPIINVGHELD